MATYAIVPWEDSSISAIKITLTAGKTAAMFTSLGATLLSLKFPNQSGTMEELTLNYTDVEQPSAYHKKNLSYYGATIGRYANRIAKGRFKLEGKPHLLAVNNGKNHLHGGLVGFDKKVWQMEPIPSVSDDIDFDKDAKCVGVKFSRTSKDLEEGYPGRVVVVVKYILNDRNELRMVYRATTDKPTIINITNHTYWNLSGDFKEPINNHIVKMDCSEYLPLNSTQIPIGKRVPVKGTPFDLTEPQQLGPLLDKVNGGGEPGFDHCFVVEKSVAKTGKKESLSHVASVTHKDSGRRMEISTNQVGVQFYTGNFLSKEEKDYPHRQHFAMCFEAQRFPNSPNQSNFPSAILVPGDTYFHETKHSFHID